MTLMSLFVVFSIAFLLRTTRIIWQSGRGYSRFCLDLLTQYEYQERCRRKPATTSYVRHNKTKLYVYRFVAQ
ncbi:hypothetical protein F5X99DRAFT_389730 [Biscogniauxia marginata]|nr:hypothetical protein F5X99DRAFT_389730 [Biscogniauxia marginata]